MKTDRLISSLLELNPDLKICKGKRSSHYKIIKNQHLIGIIPVKLSKEGLADNTKTQLRRNGVLVPGEMRQQDVLLREVPEEKRVA